VVDKIAGLQAVERWQSQNYKDKSKKRIREERKRRSSVAKTLGVSQRVVKGESGKFQKEVDVETVR
jgi:hypothetical protein